MVAFNHMLATPTLAAAFLALVALTTCQAQLSPTRSLYRYHRTDDATLTTIRIDAAHTGAVPLSQDVFGNFVEHLGNAVYAGLWANVLMNPNIERGHGAATSPPYWDQSGAAAWKTGGAGYHSPSCMEIASPDGAIAQRVYLPIQRERNYTLTLFFRAADTPGRIKLELRVDDAPAAPPILSSLVEAPNADWRKATIRWRVPDGALAVGQRARFAIAGAGGGPVDVDQVNLFPDDAAYGMDPETLRLAKAWKIPILRLSGNFSSGYNWHDGAGPQEDRPTLPNPAWRTLESNQFGTDEYLDLCRLIGATPQIGVNAGNGTPTEAAAWVAYCNNAASGERVPIWEIGNELYGNWQIGHTDADGNAARFVAFRSAMLKADPHIRLIATGRGEEFLPQDQDRMLRWNVAVLSAAAADGGEAPDWISIHPLAALPGRMAPGTPYGDVWDSVMAHPEFMDQWQIPQLESVITRVEGPNARTRIAVTEWGIIVGGDGWENCPNHNVEAGAVYNALALNTFLRNGDWVTLANVTALLHGGCIAKSHGVAYVMPEYYANKLYAEAAPSIPVETDASGPGRDIPARGALPAVSNVPDVDVFSALSADHRRLIVFVVNRRLNEARDIRLDISGFSAIRASAAILTAEDPQAGNTWSRPNAVVPQPFPVRAGDTESGIRATIPGHSLVVFTLTR